ncbi:hypothetical protein [Oryzomonas rubra]|uniref:Uncharacterized protein n=1 Tax=Oryzomonas rubra TaxID=2509454 RepID=A0A5A9X6Y1_9BACT|nr:hypothetical protein [Oryzomonas rubra]KAA0888796.1 hypothetical protein ET418_15565 [Oryzomonas rubra]
MCQEARENMEAAQGHSHLVAAGIIQGLAARPFREEIMDFNDEWAGTGTAEYTKHICRGCAMG